MSEEKSLGDLLRQTREQQSKSLEEVQRQTGTSLNVLKDLEADTCNVVEPVFARLALRLYAEYLGLDPAALEKQFDARFGRPSRSPSVLAASSAPRPIRPARKKTSHAPVIGVVSVGFVLLLLLVYFFDYNELDPGAPEQTPPIIESDIPGAATAPVTRAAADMLTAPEDSTHQEAAFANADSLLVLEVKALYATWVQVRGDDRDLFVGTVAAGASHRWEARHYFTLHSGRAHGLRYWFQGVRLGDENGLLGNPARVLRFRATRKGVTLLENEPGGGQQ